jgi:probable O-glycosylation ligase (exosortase A-associated)
MRDIALFMMIAPGCAVALKFPFVGAMLWTWLSLMNPHRMTWGFMHSAPVAQAVAICTLIGLLYSQEKRSPVVGAPVKWLVVLVAWMCITTIFAFNTSGSWEVLKKVLKIDLMLLVTLMLVRTRREIMFFAWLITLSTAYFGIKGGLFTLTSGGGFRVYGPPGTYIEENNALAVALVIAVPLLRFLQTTLTNVWHKRAMTAAMLLCCVSILGSQSRGALLAISAMLAVLWWRGKNKLATGFLIVVVGAAVLSFMPETWWDRMGTIDSAAEEDGSARGRINAWWMAFNLASQNLLGGGFAIWNARIFSMYAPDPTHVVSAHSIYFHMIGEHGFIGFFIFLGMWISTWLSAGWMRKHGGKQPETAWCVELGAMAQVSLVGFAVGGAFLSLTYYDLPYNLLALTVAARLWLQSRRWMHESAFVPNGRILGLPLFFGDRLNPQGRSAPRKT